jgi:hypothetical protein
MIAIPCILLAATVFSTHVFSSSSDSSCGFLRKDTDR